ncbi:hypothetical protein WS76_00910 [Burkholderia humptydooensis]|nr:hypothetical protein WS76_00910 [Burkholderia humptydooensis]
MRANSPCASCGWSATLTPRATTSPVKSARPSIFITEPLSPPLPVIPDSNANAPFTSSAPVQVVCSASSVTDAAFTVADSVSTVTDTGATTRTVAPAGNSAVSACAS